MDPEQQMQRLALFVERLGEFPDAEVIRQLTEATKLGLSSEGPALAKRMSAEIMGVLTNPTTAAGRRLPLLYAVDSIAKYVGGVYQVFIGLEIVPAFEQSFHAVGNEQKIKMHKLLTTWHERALFIEHLDALNAIVAPWHIEMRQRGQLRPQQQQQQQRPPPVVHQQQQQQMMQQRAPPRPARVVRPAPVPIVRPPTYGGAAGPPPPQSYQPPRRQQNKRAPLQVAVPQQPKPPQQNKRQKVDDATVIETARELLKRLQGPLLNGDEKPMTLEELEPQLYEQVMAEARSQAAADGDAPAKISSTGGGEWPAALELGPDFGSPEAVFASYAGKLAASLENRATRARNGQSPPSVSRALAKSAKDVAVHLKTLLQRRENKTNESLSRILRKVASENLVPDLETSTVVPVVPRLVPHVYFETTLKEDFGAVDGRAVDALYSSFPTQCKSDGLRFSTESELQTHMDAVFKRNRRRGDTSRVVSRVWGPTAEAWARENHVQGLPPQHQVAANDGGPASVEISDQQHDSNTTNGIEGEKVADEPRVVVPADSSVPTCRVCGEKFEIEFDQVSDEWILPDAVYVPLDDGSQQIVVHRRCRDATVGSQGTLTSDQLLPPDSN